MSGSLAKTKKRSNWSPKNLCSPTIQDGDDKCFRMVQKSADFQYMKGANILAPRIMRMEEETVSFCFKIRYMYI